MSNVYDKARELSRTIRESEEFQQLQRLHVAVERDEIAKKMLNNFRQLQLDLLQKEQQGQMLTQQEITEAQKQMELVQQHEVISQLMAEEQRVSTLIEDVSKIITEPLEELYGLSETD